MSAATRTQAATAVAPHAGDEWLTSVETGAILRRHEKTVRNRAVPSYRGPGERLHGHHSTDGTRGGTWSFRRAAVDAFVMGATHDQQIDICGCRPLAGITALHKRGTRRH
jgi:hypothetical protein